MKTYFIFSSHAMIDHTRRTVPKEIQAQIIPLKKIDSVHTILNECFENYDSSLAFDVTKASISILCSSGITTLEWIGSILFLAVSQVVELKTQRSFEKNKLMGKANSTVSICRYFWDKPQKDKVSSSCQLPGLLFNSFCNYYVNYLIICLP